MNRGFVLLYTIIIGTAILVVAGTMFNIARYDTVSYRATIDSLTAFYAADTGIECVRHFNSLGQVFDTTHSLQTYDCGVGTFDAGSNPPTSECVARTYEFTLDEFSNHSCAVVRVTTVPRTINVGGTQVTVCSLQVISNGRNNCAATGPALVERTRWEDM